MGKIMHKGVAYGGSVQVPSASNTPYSNSTSGLSSQNVQSAIDEVNGKADTIDSKLGILQINPTDATFKATPGAIWIEG